MKTRYTVRYLPSPSSQKPNGTEVSRLPEPMAAVCVWGEGVMVLSESVQG